MSLQNIHPWVYEKRGLLEVMDVCFCGFLVFDEEGSFIDYCKIFIEGGWLVDRGLGEVFSRPLLIEIVVLELLHVVILRNRAKVFPLLRF